MLQRYGFGVWPLWAFVNFGARKDAGGASNGVVAARCLW